MRVREKGEGWGRPPKETEEQPAQGPPRSHCGAHPGASGRRENSAVECLSGLGVVDGTVR